MMSQFQHIMIINTHYPTTRPPRVESAQSQNAEGQWFELWAGQIKD